MQWRGVPFGSLLVQRDRRDTRWGPKNEFLIRGPSERLHVHAGRANGILSIPVKQDLGSPRVGNATRAIAYTACAAASSILDRILSTSRPNGA